MNWKKALKGCLRIALTLLEASLEVGCSKNEKTIYSAAEAYKLYEKGQIDYKKYSEVMRRHV
ncbi:Uncharacterised protein [Legionella beliardensis]|uniref:Uncharacterized protein n=1 Tax=Legionella beliardensis TaxID=91822 RepID=A0A378JP25_9GAMM|nr:hypothetical protein [Legionella beliardensis]STX55513.1 Uncharacterised protein [Legionella beliardensis]